MPLLLFISLYERFIDVLVWNSLLVVLLLMLLLVFDVYEDDELDELLELPEYGDILTLFSSFFDFLLRSRSCVCFVFKLSGDDRLLYGRWLA